MKRAFLAIVIAILLVISAVIFLLPNLPDLPLLPAQSDKPDASASSADPSSSSADLPAPSVPDIPAHHPADMLIDSMPLEQQVAQLFWVRCPETDVAAFIEAHQPAGLLLFARDFENQDMDSMREITDGYQAAAAVPLFIGVDEEGGDVVRVSKFRSFRRWPFQSQQQLYAEGEMDAAVYDTSEKDKLLKKLGVNVNLAPVCDVSTDEDDFMYSRTLGEDADTTAEYTSAVVKQMKHDGMGSVIKHFPGYGPGGDSHEGPIVDKRAKSTFEAHDLLPFSACIEAGTGGVLVTHNTVSCYDSENPASLSPAVYDLLRNSLGFEGVAITDDLAMGAITSHNTPANSAVRAINAGCDLLLSSDFQTQYDAVLAAAREGSISENRLRESLRRVLQWKADLGLIEFDEDGPDADDEPSAEDDA